MQARDEFEREGSTVTVDMSDLLADDGMEDPWVTEPATQAPEPVSAETDIEAPADEPELDATPGVTLAIAMKRFALQVLLDKAATVVPSRDIMPVLKNFQVTATEDGKLRVVATDLELSVVAVTPMVTVTTPGCAVFPAKKLLEMVRSADGDDLTIEVADGTARIAVGRTSWTLRLQSGHDYPAVPDPGETAMHVVDRVAFASALDSVRYAAAVDATRPALMAVDVSAGPAGRMVACDGTRFATVPVPNWPVDIQVPTGALDDLVRVLRATELETIEVGSGDHQLVFRIGADLFMVNRLTSQFPDMEQLLLRPALQNNAELNVDREELAEAVKRVRINADPETSAIMLELSPGTEQAEGSAAVMTVRTRDKYGATAQEELTVGWAGPAHRVAVNHRFLADMLDHYDGRSCKFLLGPDTKTRKSPLLLKDEASGAISTIQQMRADHIGLG